MAKPIPASLTSDFLTAMQAIMPAHLSMDAFIDACQRPLRRSIRVNTLKISVSDFLALVAPYGWELEAVPWCDEGFWLLNADEEAMRLGNALEHLAGLFYIQEASSMLPVSALFMGDDAPERVLDMAAAPGSKTTQIAARLNNQGLIVANEYSASRVKVLHANLHRCGVSNTALTHFDGRVFGNALPETFDAILLDAPCSGEGVVRKDPAAMSHWSLESIADIAATQRELILSAFHALKPGGVLIYSTCTLNHQENQHVCRWLMQQFPDACEIESLQDLFPQAQRAITEDGFLHVFPQIYDSEGFFVARLRKTASVPPLAAPDYKLGKLPFTPLSHKDAQLIRQSAQRLGLQWSEQQLQLWQRDDEVWLFPAALQPMLGKMRFSRMGVKLAERFAKGYRWQHEAVVALGNPDNPNTYPLSAEQVVDWFRGKDIYPPSPVNHDEVLLTWQQTTLGLTKRVGQRLKNTLPRDLVRDGANLIPSIG
ncbi:16S rRNA (cytosine(1407)-C(5))-methyltransferase RsmF [Dickeya solani]|uniref:Ribosomal RNA small subunit methyltransferase F n=1 Tax=Dickeya solani D s0432-1 TaxID=1231725 RepID=A0AAV3K5S0_9GAMM|nr:16S rRNA (cytosine(1407)-C(5))-methyltransferase RsmF [Dickeya solani]ANE77606.1 16S rRNA (cytosine(1407)-C(5))-methyltransferase RsmF [Dickeya solani IPO 2222]AUC40946.1 Ribosomal RNA small subunit methyltransferase F [Dickeya solani RNS 08.23.3.1.A]AUH06985.1 16S rRNA (cytosine(1407)-C(5))-methyltransferase RsmF [Dickeya solani D s0432-1]AYQ48225.1 Ribosomal RNA small subunit methyltransferase F [Dickeya solani]AYQ52396.1 Ribosomal RNA small subunit methyltransferase F [Dickeya solani]